LAFLGSPFDLHVNSRILFDTLHTSGGSAVYLPQGMVRSSIPCDCVMISRMSFVFESEAWIAIRRIAIAIFDAYVSTRHRCFGLIGPRQWCVDLDLNSEPSDSCANVLDVRPHGVAVSGLTQWPFILELRCAMVIVTSLLLSRWRHLYVRGLTW